MSLRLRQIKSQLVRPALAITLCLIVLQPAIAQNKASANRGWAAFWQKVSTAMKNKDKDALLSMMPSDFFDGGGGGTAAEWLKYLDENTKNGSWRDVQKSFARGAMMSKNSEAKVIQTRVTKDNHYYFEFRKDNKWWFAGVVGD